MGETKSGCLGMLVVALLVTLFAAWLVCDIDYYEHYGWLGGIWHGIFFPENWIRSLFSDALYKANYFNGGYNVFFWIFAISSSITFIIVSVVAVLTFLSPDDEKRESTTNSQP